MRFGRIRAVLQRSNARLACLERMAIRTKLRTKRDQGPINFSGRSVRCTGAIRGLLCLSENGALAVKANRMMDVHAVIYGAVGRKRRASGQIDIALHPGTIL